jgi:hypothetical protein
MRDNVMVLALLLSASVLILRTQALRRAPAVQAHERKQELVKRSRQWLGGRRREIELKNKLLRFLNDHQRVVPALAPSRCDAEGGVSKLHASLKR